MKKLFLFLATCASSLIAGPAGSPSLPSELEKGLSHPDTSWWSFRADLTTNFLLRKRLASPTASKGKIDGQNQFVELIWNVRERLDLSVLAGVGALKLHFFEGGDFYSFHSKEGFCWGGKGKLVWLQIADTVLGGEFSGGGLEQLDVKGGHLTYRFWQASVGLSQKISFLRPYCAFGFTSTSVQLEASSRARFQDRQDMGAILGCTITRGLSWLINVEVRQFFEEAISVSGEVRF